MKPTTIKYNKLLSKTYLKDINNELSAIFNFACNIYNLSKYPVRQSGSIGKRIVKKSPFGHLMNSTWL